ncbi:sensor histidine kinase [Salininema proteolyticum]|uniref:histidine kinase n=1 Tax=Salininema proteolyticum TaxID=1607685 RepID=A0ABV8TYC2_9ACTN
MNVLRRISERWRRLDVVVRDLPLAVVLIAVSFWPVFEGRETQLGDLPQRPFDAYAAILLASLCLPLAARRRLPATSLAVIAAAFSVSVLTGYHFVAGSALPFALLSAGIHLDRHRRAAAAVLTTAYIALAVALNRLDSPETISAYIAFYLMLAAVWAIGSWVRSSRAAEAAQRRRVAETTRAAERARIARELHDVVTHHVTAMVVQTEAARYLTGAPDRLDRTLSDVTDTGRRAIGDLRHLLDLLDPDHDQGPDRTSALGRLSTLVEQARRAGQPIEFTEEGTSAAAAGSADFVAYRTVQEALTNALKYAHGSPTSVRVHHGANAITVEVGTGRPESPTEAGNGSGRGLAGLRERVDVLGGEFGAGPRPDGGFGVRARIPTGSRT